MPQTDRVPTKEYEGVRYFAETGEIDYKVWVCGGVGMINRTCLDASHPYSLYQCLLAMDLKPESFGVYSRHDLDEIRAMSREALIKEVIHLRSELEGLARAGFY